MARLFKPTAGAQGAISYTLDKDELARELGIARQEKQFETRIQAITDPGQYKTDRATAIDAAKDAIATAFEKAHQQYVAAGFSHKEASDLALAAAENEKKVQFHILNLRFPDFTNELAVTSVAKNATGRNKNRKY